MFSGMVLQSFSPSSGAYIKPQSKKAGVFGDPNILTP